MCLHRARGKNFTLRCLVVLTDICLCTLLLLLHTHHQFIFSLFCFQGDVNLNSREDKPLQPNGEFWWREGLTGNTACSCETVFCYYVALVKCHMYAWICELVKLNKTSLLPSVARSQSVRRMKKGSGLINKWRRSGSDSKMQLFGQPLCNICPDSCSLPKPVAVCCLLIMNVTSFRTSACQAGFSKPLTCDTDSFHISFLHSVGRILFAVFLFEYQ